jgi:hypothetical protein
MTRRSQQDEGFAEFLAQQETDPEARQRLDEAAEIGQHGTSLAQQQRERVLRSTAAVAAGLAVFALFLCWRLAPRVLRAIERNRRPPVESFEPVLSEEEQRAFERMMLEAAIEEAALEEVPIESEEDEFDIDWSSTDDSSLEEDSPEGAGTPPELE